MTWHDFQIIETSHNKHQGMKWLNHITIHPEINIRLQYIRNTSEYILKLQLHQHSLLTRKVFSWHNLSAQVFFSVSSGSSSIPHHLHIQVISFFKSSLSGFGSSSLDLDHPSIWIIPRFGSSLDLDHLCGIIITGSSWVLSHDSSRHKKFYRASPFFMLVIGLASM